MIGKNKMRTSRCHKSYGRVARDSHENVYRHAIRMNGKALARAAEIACEERWRSFSFPLFSTPRHRRILSVMTSDTFTLSGDYENRVAQLLRLAQHHARVAQATAAPRMQDALTELEDALSDQIAALDRAAEDDKADAEATGEAERERQAWRPMRAA